MKLLFSFSQKFLKPYLKWYLAGILFLAIANLIALEIPLFARKVVNLVSEGVDIESGFSRAYAIIGLGVSMIFIRSLSRILIFWPGRKMEAETRGFYFERVLSQTESFFDRYGMGELIARLTNDIGQLRAFFAFGVLQAINFSFLMIFTVFQMSKIHAGLTVAALLPLLLMLVIMRIAIAKTHQASVLTQQAVGKLTNRATETIVNIHVIQTNSIENTFVEKCNQASQEVLAREKANVKIRNVLFPLLTSLMNISQVVILFYGGREIINGRLSVGDILAFNVYIAYLSFPLSAIGIIINLYQRALAGLARLKDIDNSQTEEEIDDCGAQTKNSPQKFHNLKIRGLNFSYRTSNFSLTDIELDVSPGKMLGIVGSIGSGKSTLFDILARLQQPPRGTIFLDEVDILDIPVTLLRKRLAYVQQSTTLFSQSILNNLKFGLGRNLDRTQAEESLRNVQILDEVQDFKDGIDTEIGERGLRLSGGQKQRIGLARFLLRDVDFLILDDVLSAVDQRTESKLIELFIRDKRAMIIASHRNTVLQHCHELIVLERGKIVGRGTYAELKDKFPILQNGDERA